MLKLQVHKLSVSYGSLCAVSDASFVVNPGEIVALLGSNGAGKSTTLKALMGLLVPSAGLITIDGRDLERETPAARVRRGIALSPEGRRLFPRMTVLDNLLVGAHTVASKLEQSAALQQVYELFPRVAERHSQMAGSLSGGEQQMVAIGRSLMSRPKLLMLDEPSLGIAPLLTAEIAAAIRRLNKETGIAVLLVEQNARLALKMAHRAYVLEQGAVIREGSGAELLADPAVQKAYLGV